MCASDKWLETDHAKPLLLASILLLHSFFSFFEIGMIVNVVWLGYDAHKKSRFRIRLVAVADVECSRKLRMELDMQTDRTENKWTIMILNNDDYGLCIRSHTKNKNEDKTTQRHTDTQPAVGSARFFIRFSRFCVSFHLHLHTYFGVNNKWIYAKQLPSTSASAAGDRKQTHNNCNDDNNWSSSVVHWSVAHIRCYLLFCSVRKQQTRVFEHRPTRQHRIY